MDVNRANDPVILVVPKEFQISLGILRRIPSRTTGILSRHDAKRSSDLRTLGAPRMIYHSASGPIRSFAAGQNTPMAVDLFPGGRADCVLPHYNLVTYESTTSLPPPECKGPIC